MKRVIVSNVRGWMTGLLLSCGQKAEQDATYVVSDQYAVEINTWGMPGSETFQVRYNNMPDRPHPNARLLSVIRQSRTGTTVASDTLRVELSQTQLDTIYRYTQEYLQDFYVDNRLRTGARDIIHDGLSFSIAFEHDNKRLEASQYHVKDFEQASPEMGKLMRFINSKLPEDFKAY
jgi:hypothetical protein